MSRGGGAAITDLSALFYDITSPAYGASVDSADNTTAINAAINAANAAGGGIVWVPEGEFIAVAILMKSKVTLMGTGAGSILKLKASAANHLLRGSTITDIAVMNLTIDGNQANQVANRQGIEMNNVQHALFSNLFLKNTYGDGMLIDYARDVTITNIVADQTGRNGVALVSTSGLGSKVTISNVTATAAATVGSTPVDNRNAGLDIEACTGVAVTNYVADGFRYGVVCKGQGTTKLTDDVQLTGILTRNITTYGVYFDGRDVSGSNILSNVHLNGYVDGGSPNVTSHIRVEERVNNWSIANAFCDTIVTASADGIVVAFTTVSPSPGLINDCTVTGATRYGITVQAANTLVTGCNVFSNGYGINVNAADVTILASLVRSNTTKGIRLQSAVNNLTVRGCDVRSNGAGAADNIDVTAGGTGHQLDVTASGATSVADGGTISHGLGVAPTYVLVTPSVAGEIPAVTAISATTFTVAIKKHDNTAGTTQTVYWRAFR